MHPFDYPSTTGIIAEGDYDYWVDSVDNKYLSVCENQNVLEIACFQGYISRKILERHPKTLTLIDPGVYKSPVITNDKCKFYSQDIFQWLTESRPADVVVCFGLLYHLHSPLYLLELIVNHCDPNLLILDSVVAPHPLRYNSENLNVPGSRQAPAGWKTAPFNIGVPFFIVNQTLDHMGYSLVQADHVKCRTFSKSNSWVASWQKKLANQN